SSAVFVTHPVLSSGLCLSLSSCSVIIAHSLILVSSRPGRFGGLNNTHQHPPCSLASLAQQLMSADDARALNTSVRCDDHFNLDLARHVHSPGKFRINGQGLDLDLAFGLIRRTRLSKSGSARQNERCGSSNGPLPPPADSHRHYS